MRRFTKVNRQLEVLALLSGKAAKSPHDIVHDYWKAQRPNEASFDAFWEKTLRDGVVADTAFPPKQVSLKSGIGAEPPSAPPQGLEIVFRPDPTIWDGRFANNGWLQELPKPLTKLTWDAWPCSVRKQPSGWG